MIRKRAYASIPMWLALAAAGISCTGIVGDASPDFTLLVPPRDGFESVARLYDFVALVLEQRGHGAAHRHRVVDDQDA